MKISCCKILNIWLLPSFPGSTQNLDPSLYCSGLFSEPWTISSLWWSQGLCPAVLSRVPQRKRTNRWCCIPQSEGLVEVKTLLSQETFVFSLKRSTNWMRPIHTVKVIYFTQSLLIEILTWPKKYLHSHTKWSFDQMPPISSPLSCFRPVSLTPAVLELSTSIES